jgi:flagellin-like hook-associated protein FlgL
LSTIASNLANVLKSLNAPAPDPSQDPAKALRRLGLPGKAHQPYVDVVHFSASDLDVVAHQLDDERQKLADTSTQVADARTALGQISDLISQAKDLVTTNANGTGAGTKKSNQKKVDVLLAQIDDIAANASEINPELFGGDTTLHAGQASVDVDEVSRESLGKLVLNGRSLSLKDITRRGALDTTRSHQAAEGAKRSLTAAADQVEGLLKRVEQFLGDDLRPRLGDVANAVAGLFSSADSLGSSDEALQTAADLRDITLSTSTAALAVGADGWDRDRILDLLTPSTSS